MLPIMKCMICKQEFEPADSHSHWLETGHNLWEMMPRRGRMKWFRN